jgi:hypothetical protein
MCPLTSRRRVHQPALLASLLILAAAHLPAQAQTTPPSAAPAGPIERIKLTDNELNCAQIHAEAGQMDKLIADAKAAEDKEKTTGSVASAASTVADVAGKLGMLGRIGGLGGALLGQAAAQAGAGALQKAAQESAQQMAARAQQAGARKEHLTGLFLAKECKVSDLNAPGKVLSGAEAQKAAAATQSAAAAAAHGAPVAPVEAAAVGELIGRAAGAARSAALPSASMVSAGGSNVRALVGKTNKVVIAGYRVAFVGRTGAFASGTGSSNTTFGITTVTAGRSNKLDVALKNVSLPMMQAMTERLYADFAEQLKAAGLEVLPREALTRSPHYANVQPFKPKDGGIYTVKHFSDPREYAVLTPAGVPMVFLAGETFGDRGLMDLGQMKGLMFSAMDAGAAALLVQVVIDFAETSSSGRSRWINMAEVDARPVISLAPARSTYVTALHSANTIMGEWGTMTMDKPLEVLGDYATVKVIQDPNALKELSESLFRATVALGGTRGSVVYEELRLFEADPARYAELSLVAGMAGNRALAGSLK